MEWVWVGACPECSGAGAVGCLMPLKRGSSPSAAPAMGEPLLQGDCKMDLAEAEAQQAKYTKLNQLCFEDWGFFFTSHQTNTTLGPEQKLGIPLLVLPFPRLGQPSHFPLSSPLQDPTWPPQLLEQHGRKMNCGSMGLGSMVPRDEGLGLPGEQQLSQWPQPGTLEPAWLSLWGCPCSRHFLKLSGRCFKSKHCKTLPGLPLASREKKENTLESYSGLACVSSGKFQLN